jgi:AraC-like DNA-binding protein
MDNKEDKLNQICDWIKNNHQMHIGWEEMSKQFNLTHKELIDLFKIANTTPMTFVRKIKDEQRMIESAKAEMEIHRKFQAMLDKTQLKIVE